MASCTYNPGVNGSNPYAVLEVNQAWQDIAGNSSTVNWALKIYRPYNISSSASKSYSVNINGQVQSGTVTIGGSGTKTLASGSVVVPHNADGSKSINFSFSLAFEINWSGHWIGTGSASGSMWLTTIPRATTPTLSASSVDVGANITVYTPRASTAFLHALSFNINGVWVQFASNVADSFVWTVPMWLLDYIPNSTSIYCQILCGTWNGGTHIGDKIIGMTLTVPGNIVPSVTGVTISEAVSGINSKFGGYVQGVSKLAVSVAGAGVYSSTITKYEVSVSGRTYTGNNITTDVLTESGSVVLTAKVTDSRGRTASMQKTISVTAYTAPQIQTFSVVRSDSSGTADDDDGTYLRATVNFAISAVGNKNDKSYKIEYKRTSEETWKTAFSGSVYSLNDSLISSSGILNVDYEYQVRLTVSDYFKSIESVVSVGAAYTLIDYHSSGRGISFGRVAQREGYFDCYMPLHGYGGITYDIPAVSATDFNAMETSGMFYMYNVSSSQNKPIASNGWLEVVKYSTGSYMVHRYTTISGEKFERTKSAGTWKSWVRSSPANKILWSGSMYMQQGQVVTLSETVSMQYSGIVLVFSFYDNAAQAARDWDFYDAFVPKKIVSQLNGKQHIFTWSHPFASYYCSKALDIYDDHIDGTAAGNGTGTGSNGITYNSTNSVLRYVIGV